MKLQEVGEQRRDETGLLSHNWYRRLNSEQIEAYLRYAFIYLREGVADWDTPAHTRKRVHWDGGKDNKGCRHKSVWNLIGRRVKDNAANPGMWVAAHFSPAVTAVRLAKGLGLIANRPEILNSTHSVEIYDEYMRTFDEFFSQRFESAAASIDTRFKILETLQLSRDDRMFLTICDTSHVNATPFLRHAFAAEMECRRGVKKFAIAAAIDYEMQQPMYDNFIANNDGYEWLLTDEIKKVVVWLRQHWSTYCG